MIPVSPTPTHPTGGFRQRVMWGAGGLADNFMFNTLTALGTLVYVNHFKLSPALAGIALALPRVIDAFTDIYIGNLSDNTRSRFGRRKPFMLAGLLLSAFLLPLLWTVPAGPITEQGLPWYGNFTFLYIVFIASLLAVTYTLYVVPYTALGYELTDDYDERTKIISWRMYIGLPGSLAAGWLFRVASDDYFDNLAQGAIVVSVFISIIIIVFGILPILGTKERENVGENEKVSLWQAFKFVLLNKSFVILFLAFLAVIVALFSSQGIAPLLLHHYVFEGDAIRLGNYQGLLGTIGFGMSYVSMFLIGWIARQTNKKNALLVALGLFLVGTASYFITIQADAGWSLYVSGFIFFLGGQGAWLMIDSMLGDVCDEDELRSGVRQEGIFSAVKGFGLKFGQGLTFGVGGFMATYAGYDPMIVEASGLTDDVAQRMKIYLLGFQCLGFLIAMLCVCFYPIDRARAQATRDALDARALLTAKDKDPV
jgi:GPH family glycoside/pentoside/hexuronide:cation symporter